MLGFCPTSSTCGQLSSKVLADRLSQILAKRRVLSAPLVISPGLEDTESLVPGEPSPSLLGWVDINDIVRFFLKRKHAFYS